MPCCPAKPRNPPPKSRKEGLVLQGGGALGAYQGGTFEQLALCDNDITWVAGISIGRSMPR